MQMFFANQSCDAFTPKEQPCELGNYVSYAVNVSTPEHVVSTLDFAKERNLRLVIRNTGHECVPPTCPCSGIWTDENAACLDVPLVRVLSRSGRTI